MRGRRNQQPQFFYTINVDDRIRPDHPLRAIKTTVDGILAEMTAAFAEASRATGRPSVPPERLLKAWLLMALYSVRITPCEANGNGLSESTPTSSFAGFWT